MRPDELLNRGLPFNRKERFFTATVVPALLGPSWERLVEVLRHVAVESDHVIWTTDHANTQVFSEYGIGESILASDVRFEGLTVPRDTPDLVIYQPNRVLVGVEAKMFDVPGRAELLEQLSRQATVLAVLARALDLPEQYVHQVALLPNETATAVGPLPDGVRSLAWRDLLAICSEGPQWALDVLRFALDNWPDLAGTGKGASPDEIVVGERILHRYRLGDLTHAVMGRNRGLDGPEFIEDIDTESWRSHPYPVRLNGPAPNRNWFPVADFAERIDLVSPAARHVASWQVVADAIRQFGDEIAVREIHPGGGQSDVLALAAKGPWAPEAPAIWMNRIGSVQAVNPSAQLAGWVGLVERAGRADLLSDVQAHLRLTRRPPNATPD